MKKMGGQDSENLAKKNDELGCTNGRQAPKVHYTQEVNRQKAGGKNVIRCNRRGRAGAKTLTTREGQQRNDRWEGRPQTATRELDKKLVEIDNKRRSVPPPRKKAKWKWGW